MKPKTQTIPHMNDLNGENNPLLNFMQDHLKLIVWLVVLIIAAASVWTYHVESQKSSIEKGSQMLAELSDKSPAERVKVLANYIPSAPEELLPVARLEFIRALQETGNTTLIVNEWQELLKNKDLDFVASIGKAEALRVEKKYNESLAILENLLLTNDKNYEILVKQRIAFTAEEAGKKEQALKAYKELKQLGANEFIEYKINQLEANAPMPSSK